MISPIIQKIYDENPNLKHEMKSVDVAVDLNILFLKSELKLTEEKAKEIGLSKKEYLSAKEGNKLKIETVHKLANSIGYTFDVVFRKIDEPVHKQFWEQP